MPSRRPHRVITHRHKEPPCHHRGNQAGYHYGHCDHCRETDDFSIATMKAGEHLRWAIRDIVRAKWHEALHQIVWAVTRATNTGEYRHGGYFDQRFPGWRLHRDPR